MATALAEPTTEVRPLIAQASETMGGPERLCAIDFFGAVCVVPYIARLRGTWNSGDLFKIKLRVLDAYVQQDGEWNQVASNISLHPDTLVTSDIVTMLLERSQDSIQPVG
jgi:hypothetical protein